MDNLTHSLAGWALGQTGLKRKTRKGLAALILGANMPDIDVFFWWVPWEPLATHRGFTHGLIGGVLLMPPLLAGLLWLLDRWQRSRGAEFGSGLPMRFGWLLALSYVGAASHPLLDWQNSYAVQLLSPFSDKWFHNDALFIIDVWIWLMLGLGIGLSRWRERRGQAHWAAPAIVAVCAVLAYIAANGAVSAHAKAAVIAAQAAPLNAIFATPPPVAFWRRELVWRRQRTISFGAYDPIGNRLTLDTAPALRDGMDDPLAREAMTATRDIEAFMRWSLLPVAQVERGRCRARVTYGDARYGTSVTENRFRRDVVIPTGSAGC